MFFWIWSTVGSLSHPVFILTTLVFLVAVGYIAYHSHTLARAAEFGALFGYVFGVAVWGSLGYHFNFTGETKLIVAGTVIVDALALTVLARLAWNRLERH